MNIYITQLCVQLIRIWSKNNQYEYYTCVIFYIQWLVLVMEVSGNMAWQTQMNKYTYI